LSFPFLPESNEIFFLFLGFNLDKKTNIWSEDGSCRRRNIEEEANKLD
jgi:hypothetical protein